MLLLAASYNISLRLKSSAANKTVSVFLQALV